MRSPAAGLVLAFGILRFLLLASTLGAQTAVGRIASVEGDVRLDAFDKGVFIKAAVGDRLYRESMIRLEPTARATLEIGAITHTAAPGATIAVADLLASTERRSGLRWLDALARLVGGARQALQGEPEQVTLGSRAADQSAAGMSVDWAEEEPPSWADAMDRIGAGDTVSALQTLLELETRTTGEYTRAEIELWRGHCYFELGDYRDAEARLDAARRETAVTPLGASLTRLLLLELGAARLYVARAADAVAPLRELARARPADDRTPFAYLLLVESLASSGDRTAATAELRAAEILYPSGTEAADLADLRRRLSL